MTTKPPFVMPNPGVPCIPIERLDINSEQAARYVAESRPFVSRVDWPAIDWTPASLREKVGNCGVPLHRLDGEEVTITIAEFLDIVDRSHEARTEWAIHNYPVMKIHGLDGPNPELACLLADFKLPSFIRPDSVMEIYVWARNLGWYDNKSHCEPNRGAGLNLQIRGKKHVWLFPPDDAGLIGVAAGTKREDMMGPPFFSAAQTIYGPSPEHPEFKDVRCYETVLEPGDAIHIPTFWFHWFVHYDLYQLNFNVWFGTETIPLSPVSAEWAFMNALCLTLGGFTVANERFYQLPLETQDLLTAIAHSLVENRGTTELKAWKKAKATAPQITIDPKLFTAKKP